MRTQQPGVEQSVDAKGRFRVERFQKESSYRLPRRVTLRLAVTRVVGRLGTGVEKTGRLLRGGAFAKNRQRVP